MPIYEYQCERSNVNDLQVGAYGESVQGKNYRMRAL
jgi:hypothetical protein